jgi:hypothetical protein
MAGMDGFIGEVASVAAAICRLRLERSDRWANYAARKPCGAQMCAALIGVGTFGRAYVRTAPKLSGLLSVRTFVLTYRFAACFKRVRTQTHPSPRFQAY